MKQQDVIIIKDELVVEYKDAEVQPFDEESKEEINIEE